MGKPKSLHLSNTAYNSYLEAYRNHIKALGYVWHTQKSRVFIVLEFLQWLLKEELNEITQVQPAHIKNYSEYLRNRPCRSKDGVLSSRSLQNHIFTVRMFFALLQEKHIIIKNPMSVFVFSFRQQERQQKAVLSIAEVMMLY